MTKAHTNAKALGQAPCEGGSCEAGKVCKYAEDSWEAAAPKVQNNVYTTTVTTAGHCGCE